MKMKKLSLLLALVLVTSLVLTACGGDKEQTVEGIKKNGTLVVGTSPDYPPFEFIVDGKVVGLDADFAKFIADEMGVELEIKQMDFNNLLNGLSTGMFDLVMAGMNPTPEKSKEANFTDIYFETNLAILVKSDNDQILEEKDLEGKSIGVQLGTTQETYSNGVLDAKTVSLTTNPDIVMNIKTDKIDAGLMEIQVAESFAEVNPDLKVVENVIINEGTGGIAVATKKGNDKLVEELNLIIQKAKDQGLFDKWFLEAQTLSNESIK